MNQPAGRIDILLENVAQLLLTRQCTPTEAEAMAPLIRVGIDAIRPHVQPIAETIGEAIRQASRARIQPL